MPDLSAIVKAYDIRGVVPDQLNEDVARAFGAAFAGFSSAGRAEGRPDGPTRNIVIAHDMRPSSPALSAAFAEGVTSQGVNVVAAGLASTDLLYFASGKLEAPGAMFTASHNPAQYNGIKLCRAGAAPVGQETGLAQIRADAERFLTEGIPRYDGKPGTVEQRNLLPEYADYMHKLVDVSNIRHLTVVVDAGNGMAGLTVPEVFDGLPITVIPLYFELDGSFPNHEANPIEPANVRDLQAKVIEVQADAGLAFDGDADRCFVIDEKGAIVSPSTITALVAVRELKRAPGSAIIYNLITSKAVPEIVREHGGDPIRSRVGHSFIKALMAETGAVFGGEHSGHFYFRDFWNADSGMLAALHVLAALGEQDRPLSALLAEYSRYVASGEINTKVDDPVARLEAIKTAYAGRDGVTIDELDGVTVDGGTWWFNVRPSNTEPLLRLNVEAEDAETLATVRDEVLAIIRG
ncbi:MAG: phosphomannomutase [Frankiales bacterium]|nr:phosphomannomutase [Frankiales bacterium]